MLGRDALVVYEFEDLDQHHQDTLLRKVLLDHGEVVEAYVLCLADNLNQLVNGRRFNFLSGREELPVGLSCRLEVILLQVYDIVVLCIEPNLI